MTKLLLNRFTIFLPLLFIWTAALAQSAPLLNPDNVVLFVTKAYEIPYETLESNRGPIGCQPMFFHGGTPPIGVGKDQPEAHAVATMMCIHKRCETFTKDVEAKAIELQQNPEQVRGVLGMNGYSEQAIDERIRILQKLTPGQAQSFKAKSCLEDYLTAATVYIQCISMICGEVTFVEDADKDMRNNYPKNTSPAPTHTKSSDKVM